MYQLRSLSSWWPYESTDISDSTNQVSIVYKGAFAYVDAVIKGIEQNPIAMQLQFVTSEWFNNYFYFILANVAQADGFDVADQSISDMTFEEIHTSL